MKINRKFKNGAWNLDHARNLVRSFDLNVCFHSYLRPNSRQLWMTRYKRTPFQGNGMVIDGKNMHHSIESSPGFPTVTRWHYGYYLSSLYDLQYMTSLATASVSGAFGDLVTLLLREIHRPKGSCGSKTCYHATCRTWNWSVRFNWRYLCLLTVSSYFDGSIAFPPAVRPLPERWQRPLDHMLTVDNRITVCACRRAIAVKTGFPIYSGGDWTAVL